MQRKRKSIILKASYSRKPVRKMSSIAILNDRYYVDDVGKMVDSGLLAWFSVTLFVCFTATQANELSRGIK